jgi:hypothetical protein
MTKDHVLVESNQPTTEELQLEILDSKYRVRCRVRDHLLRQERVEALNAALEDSLTEWQDDLSLIDVQDASTAPN